ncbi:MAG: nucleotide pyrophosphohydrolase [Pirellulaceae bacterium]|nr:nucleotide pyrophosphohydrolase [Pirellulaceae bacterium]
MNDETTRLAELRQIVRGFVDEREWQQFHAPKNISMALAIEAAELMEHFQWIDSEASRRGALSDGEVAAIGEEMSDIFCYLMALANELGIDLTQAFLAKMEKNRQKYPAETYRGKF